MNRKLLLAAAAFVGIYGLYVLLTRNSRDSPADAEHDSDARWANEGGANAPSSV